MSAASSEERQDAQEPLADPPAAESAAVGETPGQPTEPSQALGRRRRKEAGNGSAAERKPARGGAAPPGAAEAPAAVWTSESVGPVCAVKLPVFEGPLDLLLHLIRANEVDIEDIPIARISEQYLAYLDLLRELDIDVAAEYLLMAATLAHIKSRELLPREAAAGEDAEEADPRAELARRLAAFAAFKEAALELDRRPLLGRDVFTGTPDRSHIPAREPVLEVHPGELLAAVRRVLASLSEGSYHQVVIDGFTVQQAMVGVMDLLQTAGGRPLLFEDLLRQAGRSRRRVIATFLALLELAKIQAVRLLQQRSERGEPGGPIRVHLAVSESAEGAAAPDRDMESSPERVQSSPSA